MAENDRKNTPQVTFTAGVKTIIREIAAAPPWQEKRRSGKWPIPDVAPIKRLSDAVAEQHSKAQTQIDGQYAGRRKAVDQVVQKRRQRLEAYTKRTRKTIPKEEDRYIIAGRVVDKASRVGLSNIKVSAFDLDRKYDDRLGSTRTDALGYFRIDYSADDFKDLGDKTPETYIEVIGEDGQVVYTSKKSFIQKAGKSEYLEVKLKGEDVPRSLAQGRKIDASIQLRLKAFDRCRLLSAKGKVQKTKK